MKTPAVKKKEVVNITSFPGLQGEAGNCCHLIWKVYCLPILPIVLALFLLFRNTYSVVLEPDPGKRVWEIGWGGSVPGA